MNGKEIHAMEKASIAAFAFIVVSTIWSELSAGFKAFLAGMTGHHWTSKSVLAIVVFALVYYYFSTRKGNPNMHVDAMRTAKHVALAAVGAGILIFVFYLWEVTKG